MNISTNDWRYAFPKFLIAEALKFKNCKLTNTTASAGALLTNMFGNVPADRLFLENTALSGIISNFKLSGVPTNEQLWNLYNCLENFRISSANELFSGLRLLVTAPRFQFSDTQITQNWMSTFRYCYSLRKIMYLDFKSATDVRYTFDGCNSLEEIVEIKNIEVSGISFASCQNLNHDTLIRIRNACYDYSDDTENTHNIIIGTANIAKLTEEELAEWLQKRMDGKLERRIYESRGI